MNTKNFGRLAIGSIVILLGLSFLFDKFNLFNFSLFSLWPIILVIFGVLQLTNKNITAGVILTALGVIFLLSNILNFNFWAIVFPCLIVAFGVSILFRDDNNDPECCKGTKINNMGTKVTDVNVFSEIAVFWGIDKIFKSQDFKGGNVNCVFGGFKIDLRDVKYVKEGAVIEANAVFGGGEIIVSKGTKVQVNGFGLFGGVENKVAETSAKNVQLTVNSNAVFGGVSIKEV